MVHIKAGMARSRPLRVQLTAIYNNKDRDHSQHNNNAAVAVGRCKGRLQG